MDLYGVVNNLDIFQRSNCGKGKKYPAIIRTMIVPAQVLAQEAAKYNTADGDGPLSYLQRYIDQDPDSLYLFIACDPKAGDASRDMAHEFFDEFMYDVCKMGSTFDRKSGMVPIPGRPETAGFGQYDRNMAIHMEILPALDDASFKRYYDQQIRAAKAELARIMGLEPGDDPEEEKRTSDDFDVIDMADDGSGNYAPAGETARNAGAVQKTRAYAVGKAKPIFYAIDFHCPAATQLGYDGDSSHVTYDSARGMVGMRRGNRRLGGSGGRRLGGPNRPTYECDGPERMMREFDEAKKLVRESTMSWGMMAAIAGAYKWLCQQGKCDGVVDGTYSWSETGLEDCDLFVFKYKDGRQRWVKQSKTTSEFSFAAEPDRDMYKLHDGITMNVDQMEGLAADLGRHDHDGPQQMMREFVEAKRKAKEKTPVKKPAKKMKAVKENAPFEFDPNDGLPTWDDADQLPLAADQLPLAAACYYQWAQGQGLDVDSITVMKPAAGANSTTTDAFRDFNLFKVNLRNGSAKYVEQKKDGDEFYEEPERFVQAYDVEEGPTFGLGEMQDSVSLEEADGFALNESLVRFATRLIRG